VLLKGKQLWRGEENPIHILVNSSEMQD
jgi:hypothetical protein